MPPLNKQHQIYHQHDHHHETPQLPEILDAMRGISAATIEGAAHTATAISGDHALKLSADNPFPIAAGLSLTIDEPISVKAALELGTVDIPSLEHIAVQIPRILVAVYVLAGSIILSAAGIILAEVLRR